MCVCAALPDLAPRTRVLILQHPRERREAIGTARLAARCLRGARVVAGVALDAHPEVQAALADPERPPILLWPGPGARDLGRAPPTGPVTLVAVDGTWWQAQKLLRVNPVLAALPRYGLAPAAPSEYRIRREPRAECLSTIEALAQALGLLEGEPARYAAMLVPFRAMVDAQIRHRDQAGGRPRDRSRLLARRGLPWVVPEALRDLGRVVLAAAEANAWPLRAKREHPDELVHWVSVRGDGRGLTSVVGRPTHPLAPAVEAHTGLAAERLRGGVARAALRAAVEGALGPDDVLVTWGPYAASLLAGEGWLAGARRVDLRRVAADWLRDAPGPLEAFAAAGAGPVERLAEGRAGLRVAQLQAALARVRGARPPRRRAQRSSAP